MKKAFSIGIKSLYHFKRYKLFFAQLGALALIPINKINDALLIIRNSLPKNDNGDCPLCILVLEYFMSQWMQSKCAQICGTRPQQSPELRDKDLSIEIIKEQYRQDHDFEVFFKALTVQVPYNTIWDQEQVDYDGLEIIHLFFKHSLQILRMLQIIQILQ